MNPSYWLATAVGLIVPLIHVIGILAAVHAIMTARTSQGSAAWAVALVAFPYVTLPLYLIAGRSRFEGYVDARRSDEAELLKLRPETLECLQEQAEDPGDAAEGFLKIAVELAGLPMTKGNAVQLYPCGTDAFDAMFESIEKARGYILVFFFIIREDQLGEKFRRALIAKAREGVRVYFGFDRFGSRKLSRSYLGSLREAGVELNPFRTVHGLRRFQLNFRNHRKILVVDGQEGFLGGLNVADEYLGSHPKFGRWRDTHMRLRGPAVTALQLTFLEDWYWTAKEIPDGWNWCAVPDEADCRAIIAPTGPADPHDSAQLLFVSAALSARRRLWIASPYFVPDEGVVSALKAAAMRGIDVRILLPGRADHLLPYLSSYAYVQEMVRAGVKMFRYQDGFMHSKAMVIDEEVGSVGTANLDNRSFRLNFELISLIADRAFAREVAAMLADDFAKSRLVHLGDYTSRPFPFRFLCRLSRLLAPVQ